MADDPKWKTVGELAHAFDMNSYAPQATADLAGRALTLHLAYGEAVRYKFATDSELTRSHPEEGDGGQSRP